MSVPVAAVAMAAGAFVAAATGVILVRRAPGRLLVVNHRGSRVPAVLGVGFVAGTAVGWGIVLAWGTPPTVGLEVIGAVGLVAAAGLLDDVAGHPARGFRGHFGSLVRGRPTTGILKLVVGVVVGVVLAIQAGGGPVRVAASAVLIVVSVNLWNALDVTPGRALKIGVVALATVLALSLGGPVAALAGTGLGAAVGLLPLDLAERGMLGDVGSNPLGLVAGLTIALVLPTWGVVLAAAIGLAIQVVAETVTISRVIEAVPPLRWIDGLGRKP